MQQWKKRGTYHSVLEAIQEMSGLTEEELLSPSHIEPNRIQNIPEAAECIRACAITQGMPVVIVGDYDADGITSTAILVKLLGHFGVRIKGRVPVRAKTVERMDRSKAQQAHARVPHLLFIGIHGDGNIVEQPLYRSLAHTRCMYRVRSVASRALKMQGRRP